MLENIQQALAQLWTVFQCFVVLQFITPLAWRLYGWCNLQYEPALKNHVVKECFNYLLLHDYQFSQNQFAGNLSSKIEDLKLVVPLVRSVIDTYFVNVAAVLVAVVVLWRVHVWFAIAILGWVTLMVIISIITIGRFKYLSNKTAETSARVMGNIVDTLTNVLAVHLFSARFYELSNLDKFQHDYKVALMKRRRFTLNFSSILGFGFGGYQTICLLMLVFLYRAGAVTPGDFALIITVNVSINQHLWQICTEMSSLSEDWGAIDQALRILYLPLETQDKPDAQPLIVKQGEIVFKEVNFNYKLSKPLFRDLVIKIFSGQKVGLVGFSGGGKTTFVSLILRLYDVASGKILIDGQDIRCVTQDSLRAEIGVIPQDPILFHRTVMENIRYAKLDATDQEVINAAKIAHAHDFICALCKGYQTLVGERGIKLSGGQRQRIAIARVALKNAPILILDEATSQLDSLTEVKIQEALWAIMQKKTAIVIAHRLSTLLSMDRIFVFDGGKIIEDGTHEELRAKNGCYEKLWMAQFANKNNKE